MEESQKYKGDGLLKPVDFWNDDRTNKYELAPFIPTPRLVEDVNVAMSEHYPLLVSGNRHRREMLGKSLAYEMNKEDYPKYYCLWKIRKGEKFAHGIYNFDHQAKKRDLEYFKINPDGNPIKNAEYYFKPGHMFNIVEMQRTIFRRDSMMLPILEIQDVHEADANFIEELMEFLLGHTEIEIPELDKKIIKPQDYRPMVIITANDGYTLPRNYDGVIYRHEMEFPEKQDLIKEFLPIFRNIEMGIGGPNQKVELLSEKKYFPKIETILEKLVDLFFLAKDNCLLRPGDSQFPMTIPELQHSINLNVKQVIYDSSKVDDIIAHIEKIHSDQEKIGQDMDLGESTAAIKSLIQKDKIKQAIAGLNLIQKNLPQHNKNEVIQLISIYNDISKKERMGTESELILYPMRNKLKFDILTIVDQFAVGMYGS